MTKKILEILAVSKHYNKPGFFSKKPAYGLPAIENINLTLNEGEIIGLIGESGSGKTTIGKAIIKLLTVDSGSIMLFDQDITSLPEGKFRPLRTHIQMIFQDLDAALNPNMKIINILSEILKRYYDKETSQKSMQDRLTNLLSDVQLEPDILERYPSELSGGQKRRIAIASALAVSPKIIIADEPTTGLDNYTQSLIMQLILDLQKSNNLSVILISHDLVLIKKMCQRIAVIYLGNIIEIGPAETIYSSPSHPYSKLLWHSHLTHTAEINLEKRQHDVRSGLYDHEQPVYGCRFAPRCKRYIEMGKPDICTEKKSKPDLRSVSAKHKVACHFPF